jgi:hypothetical protein
MKVSRSLTAAMVLGSLAMDFVSPSNASAEQAKTIWVACQYPQGWNSTDAGRDVNGVPPGRAHLCAVQYRAPGVILAPCADREVYSSINWSRVFPGTPIRVEYQCPPR